MHGPPHLQISVARGDELLNSGIKPIQCPAHFLPANLRAAGAGVCSRKLRNFLLRLAVYCKSVKSFCPKDRTLCRCAAVEICCCMPTQPAKLGVRVHNLEQDYSLTFQLTSRRHHSHTHGRFPAIRRHLSVLGRTT